MDFNFEVKKLEQYLFAKNKEDFFKTLVFNSTEYKWFRLMHALTKKESLSNEEQTMLKNIQMDDGRIKEYKYRYRCRLELMQLLKEFYSKNTSSKRKKDIIQLLTTDYLSQYQIVLQQKNQEEEALLAHEGSKNNYKAQQQQENNYISQLLTLKTSIDNKALSLQNHLEYCYSDKNNIYSLSQMYPSSISRIDLDKFLSKAHDGHIENFLNEGDIYSFNDKGVDACVELYKRENNIIERTFTKKSYFSQQIMNRLTLEQLEKFGDKCSNLKNRQEYWSSLFQKTYGESIDRLLLKSFSDLTMQQRKQRKDLLYEIQKWVHKNLPSKELYQIKDLIFYEILIFESFLEEYDQKKLLQYLEMPIFYNRSQLPLIKAHRIKLEKLERNCDQNSWFRTIFSPVWPEEDKLIIEGYLFNIFKDASTWKPYDKYIEEEQLKKIFFTTKLKCGYTMQGVPKYQQIKTSINKIPDFQKIINELISPNELKDILESKQITICNINNRFFNTTDDIQLLVDIKNVSNLSVSIYEINTESYFLKNLQPFDDQFNLEGICPQFHQDFVYSNESSADVIRRTFDFPELKAIQRGLFVIEFCGSGLVSRAVIRKGALTCIQKLTLSGHLLTLISEDQQICKSKIDQADAASNQKTGIWLNNRFLPVNQDGQIMVPFLTDEKVKEQEQKIIITHAGFADLINITMYPEIYNFNCSYVYNEESFLRGNKATVIIQPFLFLNGMPANMKVIQNQLVQVTLFNDQNIPSTYTFKDVKFDHKTDIIAELPIQSSLRKVDIQVSGSLSLLDGSTRQLLHTHQINFQLYDNQDSYVFINMYLKKIILGKDKQANYILYVLGKGGEPKPDTAVNLEFKNKYLSQTIQVVAKTNEQGYIILGPLTEILQVSATMPSSPLNFAFAGQRTWVIHNTNKQQYPTNIAIAQNDFFILPAASDSEINKNIYELYRHMPNDNSQVISSHLENITYSKQRIMIKSLPPGYYKMRIKEIAHVISIIVYPGEYWKVNSNYILSPGLLQLNQSNPQNSLSFYESSGYQTSSNITIESVKFQPNKQQSKNLCDISIKISLPDVPASSLTQEIECIRLHIIANTFQSANPGILAQDLRKTKISSSNTIGCEVSSFRSSKIALMNSKQLGDETCYILQRQQERRPVGNTLEKPGILLKRSFQRETSFNQEILSNDTDFREQLQNKCKDVIPTSGKIQRKQQMYDQPPGEAKCYYEDGDYSGYSNQQYRGTGNNLSIAENFRSTQCDSMLNFLLNPCLMFTNIRVNSQGFAEIKDFPYDQFSSIQVILNNHVASVTDVFTIPSSFQNKDNETLSVPSNQLKDMKMNSLLNNKRNYCEHRSNILLRSGEKVTIQADTQFIIIDNMAQFFDIQKELIVCQNENLGTDQENVVGYKFWDFLKSWQTLPKDQKLNKYNEFACHEINLFLYFKDPSFFNEVVPQFLVNKIQKTFLDYFFLNKTVKLDWYAQTEQLKVLNALELCLLILHLVRTDQQKRAEAISNSLELTVKNASINTSLRQRLFDTVILAKTKSNELSKLNQIQEQSHKDVLLLDAVNPLSNNNNNNNRSLLEDEECVNQCLYLCEQACNYDMEFCEEQMPEEEENEEKEMVQCEKKEMNKRMSSMLMKKCIPQSMLSDDFADQLIEQRKQFRPGYQKIKKTMEYIERGYYGLKDPNESTSLIKITAFWRDLAKYIIAQKGRNIENFLSENFIFSAQNHATMLSVLSVIGYSLQTIPGDYQIKMKAGRVLELQASTLSAHNLIIFQKDISDNQGESQSISNNNNQQQQQQASTFGCQGDISITQRIFDPFDQYTYLEDDPSVKVEKPVKEFLINKVYCLQTIVTNCSSAHLEFQTLVEVPQGSIPVRTAGDYTKSHTSLIQSYMTAKINTYYYYPTAMPDSTIYPATVARNDRVLSKANQYPPIQVLQLAQNLELQTFADILYKGKQQDILKFLSEKNLFNRQIFCFKDLQYQLQNDKDLYKKVVEILGNRAIYNYMVWSCCLNHQDEQRFEELLNDQDFQEAVFHNDSQQKIHRIRYFKNDRLTIDNNLILEYHPLLSSRAHNFQNKQKSKILNIQFKSTYQDYLLYLFEHPSLQPQDLITLTYYLLLQERITEAINIFSTIDPKLFEVQTTSQCQIQYDYLAAYLDIYRGQPNFQVARNISKKYINYPILSWRNLFVDLANQLSEYDGDIIDDSEQVDKKETDFSKNIKIADSEEQISMELNKDQITIFYQNINSAVLSYYQLDLEILFSRNPFMKNDSDDFSFVQPNYVQVITFQSSRDLQKLNVTIPSALSSKNLFIQLKTDNNIIPLRYFSSQLQVQIIENYGQLKVLDQNLVPLPKVYVKTYVMDNSEQTLFYRDGYTDIRGRFDYALSSNNQISNIKRFALFISSEDYGVIIKEAGKPDTLGFIENM